MPEVSKIDPADFVPAKRTGVSKIDTSDFEPSSPTEAASSPSVMDPHPMKSAVRRIGQFAEQHDPSIPANVPQTAQLAVGAGLPLAAGAIAGPEAAPLARVGAQAIAGALQPYAQYATAKAMGGNPQVPGLYDAAKSAMFNAGFSGMAELAGGAGRVAPEMERGGQMSSANMGQALKNRDFWKQAGFNDQQIDAALSMPADEAEALAKNIQRGQETKQAFQNVKDTAGKEFNERYTNALGPQANAPVDAPALAQQMRAIAEGQGQHELTPTFQKFLIRKADELEGAGNRIKDPFAPADAKGPARYLNPQDPKQAKLIADMQKQGFVNKPGAGFDVQDARDLRSELRENFPSNATPLDQKAAAQLNQGINQTYEKAIRDAGGTSEQIGALKQVDEDYGRYSEMIKTLDPRDQKYGDKMADALFDPMTKNQGAALEFINYAKKADVALPGTMDKLRESFMNKAIEESSRGSTPVNQMEVLRKMQQQWGEKGSRAVLAGMFGQDSAMANPATFSRVLGTPIDPTKESALVQFLRRAGSAPYILRLGALALVAGGSIGTIYRDPEKGALAIGTVLGMGLGARLIGGPADQAWVNFRLNQNPESLKTLLRASGAVLGSTSTLPND